MIELGLPAGALSIVCLGAHPDDIEIGCGGTLLMLAAARPLSVNYVVLTGSPGRQQEARDAVQTFLPEAEANLHLHSLPDGHLPGHWSATKQALEDVGETVRKPDLVFAPRIDDAHQDHRLIARLATTVWRDSLMLRYEIPKWDGDLGRANVYIGLRDDVARAKVQNLNRSFPSQLDRDWWSDETFLAALRMRGMECRTRYAEAFVVEKAVVCLGRTNGRPVE